MFPLWRGTDSQFEPMNSYRFGGIPLTRLVFMRRNYRRCGVVEGATLAATGTAVLSMQLGAVDRRGARPLCLASRSSNYLVVFYQLMKT